jgi:hypothetical protein
MMNPGGPEVKHLRTSGVPTGPGPSRSQNWSGEVPERAERQLVLVVRWSTSHVPSTFSIDTVAWFLYTTGTWGC